MKKNIKKLFALMLVFAMTISCVACGSKEEAADAPAAEAETEAKTEISVRVSDGLITLDPFNWTMDADHNIITNIYDTLYMMDDDTNEIPVLATDYTVAEDGLSYTFTLREGVVFSNGDPLTVNDVKYSVERYMTSAPQSSNVAGIASVDVDEAANTVTLNLSVPTPGLIDGLTRVSIVNQKFVEENMDENGMLGYNACGTGPFMYDSHIQDVSCSIVANPNYWGTAPSLTKVNFMVVTDDNTALTAIQAGDLDIAKNLPMDSWDNLVASGVVNTAEPARNHVTYVILNTAAEPFNNKTLRQAISCATNKEDINLMTQNGKAAIADSVATKYMVGVPEFKTAYGYDIERAKELLAEAGYPNGLDIGELQVLSGGGYLADSGVVLQQQLAEIGITCEVINYEANTLIANLCGGSFTIATMGQTNTNDMSWMSTYFGTEHIGGMNMAQYSNAEVDAMLAKANTCVDPEERVNLYKELLTYVDEECVYIPIYNVTGPIAWSKGLNFTPSIRPTLYKDVSWE